MPTCHSTNEEAAILVGKNEVVEGTVIITDRQTAGKGQRGNRWLSDPCKNLTFSLILKPTFLAIVHQFNLNIAISLAITDFLNRIRAGFQVKWPNDIYFGERKISGILISNNVLGDRIENAIVGIGLNINQQQFADERPTSLSVITRKQYELNTLFETLCEFLEKRYLQLKYGETDILKKDYLDKMYWFGEDHLFRAGGAVFNGRIVGFTENGSLEVQTGQGMQNFNFKEIEFIS